MRVILLVGRLCGGSALFFFRPGSRLIVGGKR